VNSLGDAVLFCQRNRQTVSHCHEHLHMSQLSTGNMSDCGMRESHQSPHAVVYHDSRCDIQHWARTVLTAYRLSLPFSEGELPD